MYERGFTALMYAVQHCSPSSKDMVELLLDWKANLDKLDCKKRCALWHAVENEQYDCCQILLERGANSKLVAYDGESPEKMLRREYTRRIKEPPETDIFVIVDKLKRQDDMLIEIFDQELSAFQEQSTDLDPITPQQVSSPQQSVLALASSGQQQLNMSPNGVVIKSAHVHSLMTYLYKYSHKWREIGMSLGFLINELDNIEQSYPRDTVQRLLTRMLNQWTQWPTNDHRNYPTLEKLCESLRSGLVGLGALYSQSTRTIPRLLTFQTTPNGR